MNTEVLTVTEVNDEIKRTFDTHSLLKSLFVSGEISNYKLHSSGHHYFTLKDNDSSISAVLFKGDAYRLSGKLQNGMKIIAGGRVSSFPKTGQYQLYIKEILFDGAGALHIAFEQLKQKLYAEGLFDISHKKPLPRLPQSIGIVTSPTGAAVRDMIKILNARFPLAEIFLYPTAVQGTGAGAEVAAAIALADRQKKVDVLLVGRGGGSIEDLWAFNEEIVARAIFACSIPIISAVGHEPDVTIADFIADARASTPSNGAELASPSREELKSFLAAVENTLKTGLKQRLTENEKQLEQLCQRLQQKNPKKYIDDKKLLVDYYSKQLQHTGLQIISAKKQQFIRCASYLDAFSPFKVLTRGYSMATDAEGAIIKSAKQIKKGDKIKLTMEKGSAECIVERTSLKHG